MNKTTFLITPQAIAEALHIPSDVKITSIEWDLQLNNIFRMSVEGNVPDKEESEPYIQKIIISGDTIYKWIWEK